MIHKIAPPPAAAPCGCHANGKAPARLGFTDDPAQALGVDWHWLLIAALAALVIFQAIDQPTGRKRR